MPDNTAQNSRGQHNHSTSPHQQHKDHSVHLHEVDGHQISESYQDNKANADHHMGHTGHGGGHGDHVAQFRRLFWINLVIAIPVVAFSPMFAMLLGYEVPDGLFQWIAPVLGTVMYIWGGKPFLTGAVGELRHKNPGMMTLIALGITVAFIASWGATLGLLHHQLEFWWELALLTVIMLLGHWIEMRSLAQTTSALDSLAALLPDVADVIHGDEIVKTPPSELQVGDIVLIRPGARVPADGEIIDGRAEMDESMITGESKPVERGVGQNVVAGTVATDSAIRVRVTATGENTSLAGIQRMVRQAQESSSKAQRLADRAAGWLFWFAIIAAIITAIVWTALGDLDAAVARTITVLVIACPHALGLAIPLVVAIATEKAARNGVLIKDRIALESMRTIDVVVFDKTGTLTKGQPVVTDVTATKSFNGEQILALAAGAERDSEHPLAQAIVSAANEGNLEIPEAVDFQSVPALGVSATVGESIIQVGGPGLLMSLNTGPLETSTQWSKDGATVLHIVKDGTPVGAVKITDEVRPESVEAVQALHKLGIEVVMMTGDAEPVAEIVANEIGIDRVFAQVRPEDKATHVASLQAHGKKVAMVGDGVNDAPALAKADVGIAIGAGTDVAIASAGVILASSDPRAVLSIIDLSKASYTKMKQNLWWAAGYNLVSVPLAAGVLAPVGFVLPMSVGAILMSVSTVVVALNAQLLQRLDLDPATVTQRILGRD